MLELIAPISLAVSDAVRLPAEDIHTRFRHATRNLKPSGP